MWVPPRKPVLVSGALTALLAQEITQTVPHVHIANPTSPSGWRRQLQHLKLIYVL